MKRTKVAVVTADYNNHKDTDEFLSSAKKLDLKGLEVLWLVVDNGSDESVRKTVEKHPQTIWMQTGKNLGFAGGFNRGMKYAKEWGADYVLIINNDTLFSDKNLVKELLSVFDNHKKAGVVSPKIYFAPEYEFYKERYKKKDEGKVIWYAGGEFDWNNVRSIHRGIDEVDKGKYQRVEKTGFVSGCCVMLKREVLEKAGYFEEKLFAYFEDNDWMQRIKDAGFEMWYNGKTSIYHKVSRTAGIGSSWTDYLSTRNRIWFAMKYASPRTKFAILREAGKLLLTGRPAQKEGVIDYFRGVWGWKKAKQPVNPEYPLELSIIVINYKTTKLMLQLLNSIFKKRSGFKNIKGGAEFIGLDNSPDEPSTKEVLKKYPDIKFIVNKENNGFSGGNNQMIDYSLGKYVLLLNSDIEVKPEALVKLMQNVYKLGERGIYAGKLFFPTGEVQDSVFKLPNALRAFEQYFLQKKGSYFMEAPSVKKPVKVEGAVMACFLIPRTVINEIGKLQEETFMYFEDIEYCRRARRADIPIYYIPDAEFIHYHGQASKKAGLTVSNERNIKAAKWYHGKLGYFMVTSVLWAGQKWNNILRRDITPESRWKSEKD
jgi:GT2 family glycosyltransferase